MSDRVQLKTTASKITPIDDVWVLHLPRFGEEGTHLHTYGMLTPYFRELGQGRLMATRCTYARCPIGKGRGELWLPPRSDCPDCHRPATLDSPVFARLILVDPFDEQGDPVYKTVTELVGISPP